MCVPRCFSSLENCAAWGWARVSGVHWISCGLIGTLIVHHAVTQPFLEVQFTLYYIIFWAVENFQISVKFDPTHKWYSLECFLLLLLLWPLKGWYLTTGTNSDITFQASVMMFTVCVWNVHRCSFAIIIVHPQWLSTWLASHMITINSDLTWFLSA